MRLPLHVEDGFGPIIIRDADGLTICEACIDSASAHELVDATNNRASCTCGSKVVVIGSMAA